MTDMPQETLDKLMQEIGVDDSEAVVEKIESEAQGTVLEKLVQSKKSLVMTVYQTCLDYIWEMVRTVISSLLPQLFLRYMTETFLEEYAKDRGLSRFPGQHAILTLEGTKDAGTALTLHVGDVFYIVEQEPRRYEVTAEIEIEETSTDFQFDVQSISTTQPDGDVEYIYGESYNAATGLVWASEEALPINSINFTSGSFAKTGEDPETDDALRNRVYALNSLELLEVGIDLYYENLLKTVPLVAHVTLDNVDDTDATLYYTLYGATGELTQNTLDEAQAIFDAGKMRTDKGVLALASAFTLDITIERKGGGTDSVIVNSVYDHFKDLKNGEDFEACTLYDYLNDLWPDMISRITPQSSALPAGRYFIPNTTVQDI